MGEAKAEMNAAHSKPIATTWDAPQWASLSFAAVVASHVGCAELPSPSKMTPPGGKASRNDHISDFLSPGCSGSHFVLPHEKKGNKAAEKEQDLH